MLHRACAWIIAGLALAMSPGQASAQINPAGVWQCEYGTRNIYRKDAHTVYYQAIFQVMPNGTVQAQGTDGYGNWVGQGQWSLSQDGNGVAFAIRGQKTDPILGTSILVFDSYMVSATFMNFNQQFPTGDIIASQCQRTQ